jgi:hypothetical protein
MKRLYQFKIKMSGDWKKIVREDIFKKFCTVSRKLK